MSASRFFLLLLFSLLVTTQSATAWEARGEPGLIRVDPDTKLAYLVRGDKVEPLWDGIYRMDDGSLLTVHSGVGVRNRPIQSKEPDYLPGRACNRLVERICGPANQCAEREDCSLARQLQAMDQEEIAQNRDRGVRTHADWQCSSTYYDPGVLKPCDLGFGRL
ncbi:MAG: hypothetical protein KDH88_05495 [Chromatiales bacterium]|nr:hypothetical protein [Chromatiales bacterium]